MPSTIIVPLDGSKAAEEALPHAKELLDRSGGQLVLLSVLDVTPEFDVWMESAAMAVGEELDDWVVERRQYLEQLAADIPNAQVAVLTGNPATQIRATVEEADDPVVVMASRGRSGIQQVVLGSVAFKVIHDVHSPVVVVRMQPEAESAPAPNYDRVLLPIDDDEFSSSIIDEALAVIGEPKPAVHVMTVLEVPDWADRSLNHGLVGDYMEAGRELAIERLAKQSERLEAAGFQVTTEIRDGDVHQEILECAEAFGAGMIAMATHGRGNIGRALIGSVAQRVVHRATRPVLLIHPRDGE